MAAVAPRAIPAAVGVGQADLPVGDYVVCHRALERRGDGEEVAGKDEAGQDTPMKQGRPPATGGVNWVGVVREPSHLGGYGRMANSYPYADPTSPFVPCCRPDGRC